MWTTKKSLSDGTTSLLFCLFVIDFSLCVFFFWKLWPCAYNGFRVINRVNLSICIHPAYAYAVHAIDDSPICFLFASFSHTVLCISIPPYSKQIALLQLFGNTLNSRVTCALESLDISWLVCASFPVMSCFYLFSFCRWCRCWHGTFHAESGENCLRGLFGVKGASHAYVVELWTAAI